ncbi:hypothetical protein C772_01957 [Bhargavaea cecembensis DSE10]|uniref:Uncharacterized protein n=1 Tax=Bhargavaea cecembensis DSE10 TaxID=1235279 RepID=M7NFE5_9BACL|nr:hypothetical protein C772_01957 [Bhargavaea cecembensis DSE10]
MDPRKQQLLAGIHPVSSMYGKGVGDYTGEDTE